MSVRTCELLRVRSMAKGLTIALGVSAQVGDEELHTQVSEHEQLKGKAYCQSNLVDSRSDLWLPCSQLSVRKTEQSWSTEPKVKGMFVLRGWYNCMDTRLMREVWRKVVIRKERDLVHKEEQVFITSGHWIHLPEVVFIERHVGSLDLLNCLFFQDFSVFAHFSASFWVLCQIFSDD